MYIKLTVLEIYLDDTRIIILRNAIGVMDDGAVSLLQQWEE